MPRRLLREPHVLAHELRTPLAILAGWCSLARDGDISAEKDPDEWARAMAACQQAVERLNLIINQACDEARELRWDQPARHDPRVEQLAEQTSRAIEHSRAVLYRVRRRRLEQGLETSPLPSRRVKGS
jgi:signal transduction histidine kinase